MFRPYSGEFLVNPSAVELDGNYCSYSCFYCYANLNKPNREASIPEITRFLSNLHENQDTTSVLMKMGYPVCLSNHVDPLSPTNRFMLDIMQSLFDSGMSVVLQTKLSEKMGDIHIPKPIMLQVTIETDKDDWGKKIAPGAPLVSTRKREIKKLVAHGHKVVVLVCPFVKSWWKDVDGAVKELVDIGVSGIWAAPMHITVKSYKTKVKEKDRALMTDDEWQAAHRAEGEIEDLVDACLKHEMPIYTREYGSHGNIYDWIEKYYPRWMPSLQEFCSALDLNDVVDYDTFMEYASKRLPAGVFNVRDYIVQNEKNEILKFKIPNNLSFAELVKVYWSMPDDVNTHSAIGAKTDMLSKLKIKDADYLENGLPVYVYNPSGAEGLLQGGK